jgi:hypothetical protein
MRRISAIPAIFLISALFQSASAQAAFPLICQGTMNLEVSGANDFTWSMVAASTTPPGQQQCAWLDRAPRGSELMTGPTPPGGGKAAIINRLVSQARCPGLVNAENLIPLQANEFMEVMVDQNPTTHNMEVQSWVGLVSPPFPPAPVEFPAQKRCTQ